MQQMQAEEERQRTGSRGQGNESTSVQLRAMQRRDELHHLELIIPPDDRYRVYRVIIISVGTM